MAVRAYLDHASTSPLRPVALAAMRPFLEESFGDPGRLHAEGRTTRVERLTTYFEFMTRMISFDWRSHLLRR